MPDERAVAGPDDARDWYEEKGRHIFGECDPETCHWCQWARKKREEGSCDSVQP